MHEEMADCGSKCIVSFTHCFYVLSIAADVTKAGKLFHTRTAATDKADSAVMCQELKTSFSSFLGWWCKTMETAIQKLSQFVFSPLLHLQPMQSLKKWPHTVVFPRRKH